ncbi:ABC transporter substrate-binding protein [Marinobacterium lutimaris]|uniref:Peptide/nickel transport system substrate-binding protein n=1 Tax=Marinobacterium lutimaris TaxID=568106 RepID=A0A1H5VFG9_9GAMM|nr:ABC transporter substrate-binding protein [Marinobacterium lutimaris]SEF86013.1 peptide/nickel transport system substrate-binding protein [Marinobacterium lutimaris]
MAMPPLRAFALATLSVSMAAPLTFSAAIASDKAPSELVLAIGGEPKEGFDPLLGWGQYGHPLFQSTLLTRDAKLESQPDLATEWTLSDDRLTWTITLRHDAVFSDGTPLTAHDVAFTFNQAASAGGALDLSAFESAEAVDDFSLVIHLKKPWITFTENFYSLGIVPAAEYGQDYGRHPIGSGPFKLISWTEGEQLIVERNTEYYGKQPEFSKITFLFTGEDTSLAAARAGQVDMAAVPPALADAAPSGFKQVVVESVDNRGITFPILADEGKTDAEGNKLGNAVTSDRAIRRAINLGVDRDLLVQVALFGHGTPASGPADGLPWSNPKAAVEYDLDAANALLDQAGWLRGEDGVREKEGVRAAFPINYLASDSTRKALAITLAEQLKALGIEAIAIGKSWESLGQIFHSEPVVFGWGSHTPLEVYSLYQSDWAGAGYYNVGYFSDAAVDAHFAAAQAAPTLEASYPDWQAAEWDGTTGYGAKGEAGWAWLVNLEHIYYVNECLDLGETQIEPHGHGWPITSLIQNWTWTCE